MLRCKSSIMCLAENWCCPWGHFSVGLTQHCVTAADDPLPSNADVLQNRADLAEDENRDENDVAAAERAYVKSLVKR